MDWDQDIPILTPDTKKTTVELRDEKFIFNTCVDNFDIPNSHVCMIDLSLRLSKFAISSKASQFILVRGIRKYELSIQDYRLVLLSRFKHPTACRENGFNLRRFIGTYENGIKGLM